MSSLKSAETQTDEYNILSSGVVKPLDGLKGRGDQHVAGGVAAAFNVMPAAKQGDAQSLYQRLMNNEKYLALFYLCTWFTLNVIITLYCKAVFSLHKFPYPMIMTTIHLVFTFAGVQLSALFGIYVPKPLSVQNLKTVLWFSVIFTLNIWASNASLLAVSVNLHQVVRTTIPLFTMAMSIIIFRDHYPFALLPSILVVVVGVAATVWGDAEFDFWGMSIVVFGCVLSSLKGIMTKKTQVGSMGMSSMDLLRYLSPLAVIQLLTLAALTGEISKIRADEDLGREIIGHLVALGVVAFFLNFVSFRNGALNDPLTLNIAGNVKQVLTSLLSIWIFGGTLSSLLTIGIILTAVGAFWYSQTMQGWRKRVAAASVASKEYDVEQGQQKPSSTAQPSTATFPVPAGGQSEHRDSGTRGRLSEVGGNVSQQQHVASGGALLKGAGYSESPATTAPSNTREVHREYNVVGGVESSNLLSANNSGANYPYEVEMYAYDPKRV